jgi:hypothetical protein
MKVTEILRISTQDFPIRNVQKLLSMAQDGYGIIDNLTVNYLESDDQRIIILTDKDHIAAYAGFISRLNGRVWQAKNLQTYGDYRGKKLGAKIYEFVKETFNKSIQSDIEQSPSAEKLWTKTLPELGMHPKIFDTETDYIIDASYPKAYNNAIERMYTNNTEDADKYRYTWVLEVFDKYNENAILREGQLIMPYKGIWYNFKEEKV